MGVAGRQSNNLLSQQVPRDFRAGVDGGLNIRGTGHVACHVKAGIED